MVSQIFEVLLSFPLDNWWRRSQICLVKHVHLMHHILDGFDKGLAGSLLHRPKERKTQLGSRMGSCAQKGIAFSSVCYSTRKECHPQEFFYLSFLHFLYFWRIHVFLVPITETKFPHVRFVFMSETRRYKKLSLDLELALTAMTGHLSRQLAPLDLQQGGNF